MVREDGVAHRSLFLRKRERAAYGRPEGMAIALRRALSRGKRHGEGLSERTEIVFGNETRAVEQAPVEDRDLVDHRADFLHGESGGRIVVHREDEGRYDSSPEIHLHASGPRHRRLREGRM